MTLPKIKAADIRYLALEGGGGKGNAFVGALRALADPRLNVNGQGVLQFANYRPRNVLGFSGASAGAITSCMLSCGFDPDEIVAIMANQDFDAFFDPLLPGFVPGHGQFRTLPRTTPDARILQAAAAAIRLISGQVAPSDLKILLQGLTSGTVNQFQGIFASLLLFLESIKVELPAAAKRIGSATRAAVDSLAGDLGIFPGHAAREFIHKWVIIGFTRATSPEWLSTVPGWNFVTGDSAEARRHRIVLLHNHWGRDGARFPYSKMRGVTFREHERVFGTKLAVTGTELEMLKTHLFSASTTPNFFVEDAVRISMSLPAFFKPYVLRGREAKEVSREAAGSLEGVWVDGGLMNNLPLHAFDREPGDNPKTFGLRLGFDPRKPIQSLGQLLLVWPVALGFTGSGESQVSFTIDNVDASIMLDPSPLGLMDFSAPPAVLSAVQDRALNVTLRYFLT